MKLVGPSRRPSAYWIGRDKPRIKGRLGDGCRPGERVFEAVYALERAFTQAAAADASENFWRVN
jgi:hypothetical protein